MTLTTRGGLTPAVLKNTANNEEVKFMFNPNEYTLNKTNAWAPKKIDGLNVPAQEFGGSGAQTLSLKLYFDTAESGEDVRDLSKPLWTMAMLNEGKKNTHSKKSTPPAVEFSWGALYFKAIITSVTEKLSLFTPEGVPIRSEVDVKLTEYNEAAQLALKLQPQQGGANSSSTTTTADSGDRIDHVADRTTGDAGNYRDVASGAGIDNPLASLKGLTI